MAKRCLSIIYIILDLWQFGLNLNAPKGVCHFYLVAILFQASKEKDFLSPDHARVSNRLLG
jgi:hypothetical protein